MTRRKRIAIVGTGKLAQSYASIVKQRSLGEVVAIDVLGDSDADPLLLSVFNPEGRRLKGTLGFQEAADSDVAIVTANCWLEIPKTVDSAAHLPFWEKYEEDAIWEDGESMYVPRRSVWLACFDLLQHSVMQILLYSPDTILLLNTTPWLDEAMYLGAYETANTRRNRILGLESGALKYQAISASDFNEGPEHVEIIESVLRDRKKTLLCAARLEGEFGIQGRFARVPCVIGRTGIEQVIESHALVERPSLEASESWLLRWFLHHRKNLGSLHDRPSDRMT